MPRRAEWKQVAAFRWKESRRMGCRFCVVPGDNNSEPAARFGLVQKTVSLLTGWLPHVAPAFDRVGAISEAYGDCSDQLKSGAWPVIPNWAVRFNRVRFQRSVLKPTSTLLNSRSELGTELRTTRSWVWTLVRYARLNAVVTDAAGLIASEPPTLPPTTSPNLTSVPAI